MVIAFVLHSAIGGINNIPKELIARELYLYYYLPISKTQAEREEKKKWYCQYPVVVYHWLVLLTKGVSLRTLRRYQDL